MATRPFRSASGAQGEHLTTDTPGQRLKRVRERLNLRYRDVEDASLRIAEKRGNDEYILALSRLSDIENKGTLPSVYKMYTLCAIYRLDLLEVLHWYGVDASMLPADAAGIEIDKTHPLGFQVTEQGEIQLPLRLDPGMDFSKTTYLSRMIQKWGRIPLMLLNGLDLQAHRYAFVGSEDWSMYPLLPPTSLILIDENRRKIEMSGWTNEFERPIYFFEHREGFAVGWCHLDDNRLVLQPHPASICSPQIFKYPEDIDVIGQVVGMASRLDQGRKRRPGPPAI